MGLLVDPMEGLSDPEPLKVDLREDLLVDPLEGLLDQIPLLQQEGSVERPFREIVLPLDLKMGFRVLEGLQFRPSLQMLHRALSQVWPLRLVLVLVLQMFSCRSWSSLTTPYLAA